MRRYETIFIVTPDCSDEELKAVSDKFQGVVSGMKGRLVAYDEQGKKKLAYEIKKHGKGFYVLMDYLGESDLVAELERNMRLDDRILKYLTVKLEDDADPESIQVREPRPRRMPESEETSEEVDFSEGEESEDEES
jgi:small subunit ribosomal protein S6